jgi:hypothetical protein
MKRIIVLGSFICLFAFLSVISAENGPVVSMEFYLNSNDTIALENVSARQGEPTLSLTSSDYKAALTDTNGRASYAIYFNSGLLLAEERADGENSISVRERSRHLLSFPYSGNSGKITVYHSGLELTSFNISSLCNSDYICGSYENSLSCPSDCPVQDSNAQTKSQNETHVVIIVAFMLVLGILFAVYRKFRTAKQL